MTLNATSAQAIAEGSAERFGYEWSQYNTVLPEHRAQLERWLGKVTLASFEGKTVLDVGCGMGRNSYWVALEKATRVVSIDVDAGSLASARRNLAPLDNTEVHECSVYDLNSKERGLFQRVMCIGVLHHLPDPITALDRMWECVAPGGELILWCYGKNGNRIILPAIQLLRFIGSRLPIKASHAVAKLVSAAAWPFIKGLPWRTEYYRRLKTLSFKNVESIIFDQMLPHIAHYWTREDMEQMAKRLSSNFEITLSQGNSWSARIAKPNA